MKMTPRMEITVEMQVIKSSLNSPNDQELFDINEQIELFESEMPDYCGIPIIVFKYNLHVEFQK